MTKDFRDSDKKTLKRCMAFISTLRPSPECDEIKDILQMIIDYQDRKGDFYIVTMSPEKFKEYMRLCEQIDVIKSVCTCENSEKEKDSSVPVFCNNCNAYVQTDL